MPAEPDRNPAPPDATRLDELTRVLVDLRGDGRDAPASLVLHLVEELRKIARSQMRFQQRGHTLQTTALVHEAYLKVFDGGAPLWNDRAHFFATAARAMRQLLVDHARRRRVRDRDRDDPAELALQRQSAAAGLDADALDVHGALEELARLDARQAEVVEMRYFGGFEVVEVAAALDVSEATVAREWRSARAWLGRRLRQGAR